MFLDTGMLARKTFQRVALRFGGGGMQTVPTEDKNVVEVRDALYKQIPTELPGLGFFKTKPVLTNQDQIDMYGPTSIRKLELEAMEAGFDLFGSYDDNTPYVQKGEGTIDDPYIVPSRNVGRVVMLDETDEAPGVQGIGIPRLVFWVWQDGDGHSPNGMTRDPWFGSYWKLEKWEMPEIEIAAVHSHGEHVY